MIHRMIPVRINIPDIAIHAIPPLFVGDSPPAWIPPLHPAKAIKARQVRAALSFERCITSP